MSQIGLNGDEGAATTKVDAARSISWQPGQGSPALAAMLDDVRALIIDAQDRGSEPEYLLLDDESYQAVAAAKRSELARAAPLYVLGLRVVRRRAVMW